MITNKKASAESTIKWIFALIAGGIILSFFMNIYSNHKAVAVEEALVDIRMKLNNILANAQGHPNTVIPFTVTDINLKYGRCTKGYCLYMNDNKRMNLQLSDLFTFHNLFTYSERLLLFTSPFYMPYKITNFIYITSPDILFVFLSKKKDRDKIDEEDITVKLLNERYNKVFKGEIPTIQLEYGSGTSYTSPYDII